MTETKIQAVGKEDIKAPTIEVGGTAIVLQRHEKYQRDRTAEDSGSLFSQDAEAAKLRDEVFFREALLADPDTPTYVLFVSSDTQYNGKGHRSLETAELAKEACAEVMTSMGIEPAERIINLNDEFSTRRHDATDQDIRPMKKLREPGIFDTPEYVDFLRKKYGKEDGPGTGISKQAWAAHEEDAEKEVREEFGAEGVHDIVDRTKRSLEVLQNYARLFHKNNPDTRLIVWAASHYDTISPLVKDATDTSFGEFIPVDYGAGVVINLPPNSDEAILEAQSQKVALNLGKTATLS